MKIRLEGTEGDCDKTLEIFSKTPGFRVKNASRFHANIELIGKVNPIPGRVYVEIQLTDQETGEIV